MTTEIEPIPPKGEKSEYDEQKLTQKWVAEALVVAGSGLEMKYVVTKVISGHNDLYEKRRYGFGGLKSAQSSFILTPEDLFNYSYRGLVGRDYYKHAEEDDGDLDTLLNQTTPVAIGDRIRVARWEQLLPSTEDNVWGGGPGKSWIVHNFDTVTILESGIDIHEEEARELARKKYIRKNLAGILKRLEAIQLQQQPRVESTVDSAINWRYYEAEDEYHSQFVYGEAPIKDHFVTVKGERPVQMEEVPLGGHMRFTTTGRAFIAREITAGAPSKELVLAQEPMVELSGTIWTEMEYNPAVDNARLDFVLDGVRYAGVLDVETSTRSFRSPGHHLHFDNFTIVGEEYDGIALPEEDRDALLHFMSQVRDLRIRAMSRGIEMRKAMREIGEAASEGVVPVGSKIQDIVQAGEVLFEDLRPLLDSIKARPSDEKLGLGGKLLVPKSRLKDVRVIIGNKADGLGVDKSVDK